MLFDVEDITCDTCTDKIQNAIRAVDPGARVDVNRADGRVRVEGLLTESQAIDAIRGVGFPAAKARPHSGEGSSCCGGCS